MRVYEILNMFCVNCSAFVLLKNLLRNTLFYNRWTVVDDNEIDLVEVGQRPSNLRDNYEVGPTRLTLKPNYMKPPTPTETSCLGLGQT